jgi:phospholipid/cholesterol/gamma-HCH transport system substrate-binding protein
MIKPSDKKNYLISGIFIFSLFVVVILTILLLDKENPLFSNNVFIKAEVKNAQNLKEGAAVQLRGIRVGVVKSIAIKDLSTLEITLGVDKKYSDWVKVDSIIAFKTQGVLGDKFLEISGGTLEAKSIQDDDVLKTQEESVLEHLFTKGEDLIVVAGNILQKFDQMLTRIEPGRLDQILTNLDKLTAQSNQLMTSINSGQLNQSLINLQQSSEALKKVTGQIEKGPGTLHSLIYDQGLHEDLRSVLGGANRNKVLKYFIRESIKKGEDQ